jgi:hypothetical protein
MVPRVVLPAARLGIASLPRRPAGHDLGAAPEILAPQRIRAVRDYKEDLDDAAPLGPRLPSAARDPKLHLPPGSRWPVYIPATEDKARIEAGLRAELGEAELPVLDRNFTKFLLLTPGTQEQTWNHAASENPRAPPRPWSTARRSAVPATSSTAPTTAT